MATPKISQKEYLKKYLSNDDKKTKKKKKKKHQIGQKTVKIIDDDVDWGKIRAIEDDEFDIVDTNEDAPQIVGIVDERGPANFSDASRWKIIADDGTGEIVIQEKKLNKRDEDGHEDDQNQGTSTFPKTIKQERDSEDELRLKRNEKSENRNKRNRKRDDDNDISPPRQRKSKSSKRKDSSDSDSDLSPPRNKSKRERSSNKKRSSSSESDRITERSSDSKKKKSPERSSRNKNKNYNSDLSPPRKSEGKSRSKNKNNDSDLSPPRKSGDKRSRARNKNSDSDLSPPRKSGRKDSDSDLSPPRKSGRKDSDSDLSPPRKSGRKGSDSDLSPPRITIKKEKHSYLSPPRRDKSKNERASSSRRKRKDDLDQDLSPPRIRRRSREGSPRRSKDDRRYEKPSRSDGRFERPRVENRRDFERNSPPRRNRNRSESPPRRLKKSRWNRESRSRSREVSMDKRMKKTLDGKTAGLQNAKALREETDAYKKREKEMFEELIKVSDPHQPVIRRDKKSLRRRDLEAEAAIEREKQERQQEINEQYEKWGGGLKQLDDREEKLKSDLHEMTKPLARYRDDKDLEEMQRNTLREADPMLQFATDKLIEQGVLKKASISQSMAAPNRFGISPGARWDGVDRSNGYEKQWFEAQNRKKAISKEAYKWSTADM